MFALIKVFPCGYRTETFEQTDVTRENKSKRQNWVPDVGTVSAAAAKTRSIFQSRTDACSQKQKRRLQKIWSIHHRHRYWAVWPMLPVLTLQPFRLIPKLTGSPGKQNVFKNKWKDWRQTQSWCEIVSSLKHQRCKLHKDPRNGESVLHLLALIPSTTNCMFLLIWNCTWLKE